MGQGFTEYDALPAGQKYPGGHVIPAIAPTVAPGSG